MPISKRSRSPAQPVLKTLLERRQQVVRLFQAGTPVMQIAEQTGMGWQGVRTAIDLFEVGGEAALKPAARGRKPGSGRSLSHEQEAEVRSMVRAKRPSFYGFESALWSRENVQALIAAKLDYAISTRLLAYYLERWGLVVPGNPRDPASRCSPQVRQWLEANYPRFVQEAKATDALIYWVNKPVMLSRAVWSPPVKDRDPEDGYQGQLAMPTIRRMVSVSNNQGKLLWSICPGLSAPNQI